MKSRRKIERTTNAVKERSETLDTGDLDATVEKLPSRLKGLESSSAERGESRGIGKAHDEFDELPRELEERRGERKQEVGQLERVVQNSMRNPCSPLSEESVL